jgi:hypothetical protein
MSEKIYTWLLRLYHSHFREAYGDEALQVFRDRSCHERGFFPSLYLWLDLLADLAFSVPRLHLWGPPSLVSASARPHPVGTPSFRVLDRGSLRPGALLFGGALSLVAFSACSILINYAEFQGPAWMQRSALSGPAPEAVHVRHGGGKPNDSPRDPMFMPAQSQVLQQPSQQAKPEVDDAERHRVIHASIENLKQHYINPDVAQKVADALLAHEKGGDYDAITDGAALADLLTRQMRDVSHDRNLIVVYSKAATPDRPPGPTAEGLARYRTAMEQSNCTFEKVAMLPHNIGYLKLNSFPDPSICQATATAALASLNQADAIIFDLRDNTGGFPKMVALIAAYLFDHPEYLYNPRENTTEQSWTASPVPGNRLADKPVYVLTSVKTFSGAEQFSYDLKMLKRATLVGETTGGGAHAGTYRRIDEHFGMGITETRAINPFSKTDWDGTGVEPDVKVKSADALERAKTLAERKLRKP